MTENSPARKIPNELLVARAARLRDEFPPDQHPLMTALGRGLPITLLADLIDPDGPRSVEMIERERPDAARRDPVARRDAAGGAHSA